MEEKNKKKDNTGTLIFIGLLAGFAGYRIGSKHMVNKFKKSFDVIRFTNGKEKIFLYYNKKQKALVDDFCLDHAKMREELHTLKTLTNKEGK